MHPNYIWGLDFAIRRRALFDLGGFHPDCISDALQHFQGDGETGLTMKAFVQGYKAVFTSRAKVYHFISASRMTPEYFERRAYYQGVCDSYSRIRREGRVTKVQWHLAITSQFRARESSLAQPFAEQNDRMLENLEEKPQPLRERSRPVSDTQVVAIQQRIQRAYKTGFESTATQ